MTKTKPQQLAYTERSAAEATSLPSVNVKHAITSGDLPATKSGRRWIILHEDLVTWLRTCKTRGSIPTPVSDADRERLAALNRARKIAAQ